jgi:hypothetical protein
VQGLFKPFKKIKMKTHTSKQAQRITELSGSGLVYRAKILNLPVRYRKIKGYLRERYFNEDEIFALKNFNNNSTLVIPEIVYVNWMYIPSKMNYYV